MPISPFKLERFFAKHEFTSRFLLSPSDCESLPMAEVLEMAAPDSLALWRELKLGYTESAGHPLLRAEIAGLYRHIPPDRLVVSAPEEAIFIVMQTLLAPGDHVAAVWPAYQSLHEVARSMGCTVTPWKLELGADGWEADLDRLSASLTGRTRLLVLNFPHNPTGHQLSRGEFGAIVEMARSRGLYVLSDEMHRLLELDEEARLPPLCDVYERGISLSGLSKSFALPGLRIGWLAAQEAALTERWLAFKDYTTICSSAPSEILGIIALQNKERILKRNLEIIRVNLDLAGRFFEQHRATLSWIGPKAGSVAFPRFLGEGRVEDFCQDALERQGVLIVPGSLFDFPGNHFRVGLGRRNFSEALERAGRILKDRRLRRT